ncbi:MAG: energy transducer TonB [Methylovirgula sp.]
MSIRPSISALVLAVSAEDRLLTPADPIWRAAKRRFGPLLVGVLLLHATLIAIFILSDEQNKNANLLDKEIPVEVIVEPSQPPPPPPQKKAEQQPKPQPEKPKYLHEEKPAFDAPRTPTNETLKRESTDNQTRAPTQAKPVAASETKPTPDHSKAAQNAAPEAADRTVAPDKPEDTPDAEPLDKAAPLEDARSKQRVQQAKEKSVLPDDERAAVARQLASLMPSPDYSIAAESKVAPVMGGTEDMRYLSVLYGLIMRQQRFPSTPHPRHRAAQAVVAFWIDETGAIIHEALYRTSGYPELDAEAMADVRRAAPFPQPPMDEPHGFIAQMVFPPK